MSQVVSDEPEIAEDVRTGPDRVRRPREQRRFESAAVVLLPESEDVKDQRPEDPILDRASGCRAVDP